MGGDGNLLRVLCSRRTLLSPRENGLRWLIGAPLFLPSFNVVSSFRCIHYLHGDPCSPDFTHEADDIRTLLIRGFDIVGALLINDGDLEFNARKAAEASCMIRNYLSVNAEHQYVIGAAADLSSDTIQFFKYEMENFKHVESLRTILFETNPEKLVWEKGCLIRCELALKVPIYAPEKITSDMEDLCSSLTDLTIAELKDPSAAFLVERPTVNSDETSASIVLHGSDLDFGRSISENLSSTNNQKEPDIKDLACFQFCSKNQSFSFPSAQENADVIRVTMLSNRSRNIIKAGAPVAKYFPAEPASCAYANFMLDVLCYSSKQCSVASAISKLVVPGLIDQLITMKDAISPHLLTQHPQLKTYHFLPPGILHPITAIYDLRYGENEVGQRELRRSLHSRLGLSLDRPLLRIANALSFDTEADNLMRIGYPYLKNVHTQIPVSGVFEGIVSLVDGSYQYYHYLLDGMDDNGWGCAYRSLQTIISWFRLQHYTSIGVPSHREIQQALVDIGDKEPSFVGSREWIGAIELGFVLDKLLGVSCKIMNLRSGAELPEKCRELAMHFESQGTPVMIGGGVLAYTLLGVDYNEANGDCAFLILDPHYTGNDDIKKIVNGGWCGWKKAVDSKGRSFFLKDKFYNLLLPQRPYMV
ncbi:probable Ufm1-specific protease isoform X2 [Phalaenopsis equestris]|uniref:probable Ufm1-specific protease isoform X2 n=1 Tax=Phalaenopsis equestris TaxID=78828 RepID=UPI0009E1FB4B|nr:probable Ufm1-specific protease isoform X2 [Phalaenopsis equestris]